MGFSQARPPEGMLLAGSRGSNGRVGAGLVASTVVQVVLLLVGLGLTILGPDRRRGPRYLLATRPESRTGEETGSSSQ